jgi:4-amino-4-deoxy-L-arabinose transferase-like glycosyltransferase
MTPTPSSSRHAAAAALVVLAALAAWVFFYRLGAEPLTDWDEAWHAQVSGEILSTGDWITLHYRGEPYYNKPPLTFWLRAIAFKLAGVTEAAARFWPALFAWGSVIAAAIFFSRLLGKPAGLMSGAILCTSWLFTMHHAGRSGETDSTLIFFLILTFAALWRARRSPAGFYVAALFTALGWMTKGSTAYVPWIAAAIAVGFERPAAWRWRHFLRGLALTLALTLPWQLTMLAMHGRAFVRAFYIGEGAMPAVQAIENHPGDWRYYPMMLHALFEPWFLLAAAATAWTLWRYRRAPMPPALWLIAWAVVVLGLCTLFATKMAWYMAPALPAIAALAALAMVELSRRRAGWITLAAAAAFAAYQLQIKSWPPLSVRLALAATAAATLVLILAPAVRARSPIVLATACCAIFPLALHARVMYAAVARAQPMVDWMDLRDPDEPWRELSARLARDLPARPIVLVEFPPDPASYFYLARLHAPPLIESCPLPGLSQRLAAGDRPTVIIRHDRTPNLEGFDLHERFRDHVLIVLTPD